MMMPIKTDATPAMMEMLDSWRAELALLRADWKSPLA